MPARDFESVKTILGLGCPSIALNARAGAPTAGEGARDEKGGGGV